MTVGWSQQKLCGSPKFFLKISKISMCYFLMAAWGSTLHSLRGSGYHPRAWGIGGNHAGNRRQVATRAQGALAITVATWPPCPYPRARETVRTRCGPRDLFVRCSACGLTRACPTKRLYFLLLFFLVYIVPSRRPSWGFHRALHYALVLTSAVVHRNIK